MRKIFILIFALLSLSMMAAVSLVVKPLTGEECFAALSEIGKITFSGDSMYVYDTDKVIVFSDLLKNVQHVRFAEGQPSGPTDVDNTQDGSVVRMQVYPNPTQDVLHVENASGDKVRLYSAMGQLMQTVAVEHGMVEVDLSGCSAGGYILLCGNEVFRVVKK